MSGRRFYISDTHFHHANILNFMTKEGLPLRPFRSVHEMNQYVLNQWNSVVSDEDTVVHLGDVSMKNTHKWMEIISELNGRKILIKGNHDSGKLNVYSRYFDDIRSYEVKHLPDGRLVIFSHIPIRVDGGRFDFNVHGHTHSNDIPDDRYMNICVEKINYTPIEWNDIVKELMRRI